MAQQAKLRAQQEQMKVMLGKLEVQEEKLEAKVCNSHALIGVGTSSMGFVLRAGCFASVLCRDCCSSMTYRVIYPVRTKLRTLVRTILSWVSTWRRLSVVMLVE